LCSKFGNIPPTWKSILGGEKSDIGMVALLRNLRSILQMGFPLSFLDKAVFRRIASGGGQTPVTLAQTLGQMKKDFTDERLEQMVEEATAHKLNIMTFLRIRKLLRGDDASKPSHREELVVKFLGVPLCEGFSLKYQGGCYLQIEEVSGRAGATALTTKNRIIPFIPPNKETMKHLQDAFLNGIQRSNVHGVPEIGGSRHAIVWFDPAPAAAAGVTPGLADGESKLCGQPPDVPVLVAGKTLRLEQVVTSKLLNLEISTSTPYISCQLSVKAWDWYGNELWNTAFHCNNSQYTEKKNNVRLLVQKL
jgi:hypothetical protein